MYKVAILMSTYNGAKFLKEQIESIMNQHGVDITLIVRDDGSSDGTKEILSQYESRNKNVVVTFGEKNLGACGSFIELISNHGGYDYYALADQDDVWENDKIISAIEMIESCSNTTIPVLYHSNLTITNEFGESIRLSHSTPHELHNRYEPLISLSATGCTIVYNDALAKIVEGKCSIGVSMHDTYLLVVASLFGKVVYDFNPHILYRQHTSNAVGTYLKRKTAKNYIDTFKRIFCSHKHPRQTNARIIKEMYGDMLSETDLDIIDEIINYNTNFRAKIKLLTDKRIPHSVWKKRNIINVLNGEF